MELWLGQACGKDMKVWQLDQALAFAHAIPADSSSPMMAKIDQPAARTYLRSATKQPSSVMKSRRFMPDMGLPPRAVGLPHPQPSTEGPVRAMA